MQATGPDRLHLLIGKLCVHQFVAPGKLCWVSCTLPKLYAAQAVGCPILAWSLSNPLLSPPFRSYGVMGVAYILVAWPYREFASAWPDYCNFAWWLSSGELGSPWVWRGKFRWALSLSCPLVRMPFNFHHQFLRDQLSVACFYFIGMLLFSARGFMWWNRHNDDVLTEAAGLRPTWKCSGLFR